MFPTGPCVHAESGRCDQDQRSTAASSGVHVQMEPLESSAFRKPLGAEQTAGWRAIERSAPDSSAWNVRFHAFNCPHNAPVF